jgi:threonine/homoserine/homoserine lactone efflux protein
LKISKKVINNKTRIPETTIESIFLGLTTSLINPKILIFFTSIFSQFINQDYSIYTKFGMALLAGIIDSTWYILVCYSISIKIVENYIRSKQKLIFFILGIILIIFSFYLAFKAIKYFILIAN